MPYPVLIEVTDYGMRRIYDYREPSSDWTKWEAIDHATKVRDALLRRLATILEQA